MPMKIKRLGESDLRVTEIGLGCMSLGTNRREATDIIHRAFDLGVTFFDTADLYDYGSVSYTHLTLPTILRV